VVPLLGVELQQQFPLLQPLQRYRDVPEPTGAAAVAAAAASHAGSRGGGQQPTSDLVRAAMAISSCRCLAGCPAACPVLPPPPPPTNHDQPQAAALHTTLLPAGV
jgi:hypothetical protein